MSIDPAWLAFLAAVGGGMGVKLLEISTESLRNKRRLRQEEEARVEAQLAALKNEVKTLEDELDKWKESYYSLKDEYLQIKTELQINISTLKNNPHKQTGSEN